MLNVNKVIKKDELNDFILNLHNGKNIWYGSYDIKRKNFAKRISEYLLNNAYIFDVNSEYYLTEPELRKLVREKMMSNSYLKIDLKSYILELKSKMLKNDK